MAESTFVRIIKDDVQGRYRVGEVGRLMENNFDKYDFFVDLGTQYMVLFGKIILAKRHYYFYKGELSILDMKSFASTAEPG